MVHGMGVGLLCCCGQVSKKARRSGASAVAWAMRGCTCAHQPCKSQGARARGGQQKRAKWAITTKGTPCRRVCTDTSAQAPAPLHMSRAQHAARGEHKAKKRPAAPAPSSRGSVRPDAPRASGKGKRGTTKKGAPRKRDKSAPDWNASASLCHRWSRAPAVKRMAGPPLQAAKTLAVRGAGDDVRAFDTFVVIVVILQGFQG